MSSKAETKLREMLLALPPYTVFRVHWKDEDPSTYVRLPDRSYVLSLEWPQKLDLDEWRLHELPDFEIVAAVTS